MTAPLDALIPIIQENLDKGNAARDAYYRHLGGLLREAEAHFPPGEFLTWLRRQIKAGKFGRRPSPYGQMLGLRLEDELIEAMLMCPRFNDDGQEAS